MCTVYVGNIAIYDTCLKMKQLFFHIKVSPSGNLFVLKKAQFNPIISRFALEEEEGQKPSSKTSSSSFCEFRWLEPDKEVKRQWEKASAIIISKGKN